MDEQEQQNGQDSFFKQQLAKGKDKLKDKAKDDAKKAIKKKIIAIIAAKFSIILIVIAVSISLIVLLAGFLKVIDDDKEDKINDAKGQAIQNTYSTDASTTVTDEYGNIINKVVIKPNATLNGYEIAYNDDSENLENIKQKLEKQKPGSSVEFSDLELGVLGALIDNGANLENYSVNELHCFLHFIKAEASTQNLDLRPNSEKESGKNVGDYIENYIPQKLENLEENEVPGVILVQRTNTNSLTPITLEYKVLSEFEALIENNDPNAMNYFSISEDGKLLIAKWEHEFISVEGEYPANIDEAERDVPTGEQGKYNIKAEPIDYNQYLSKYTMPFELLIQLLVITEEPEFCMELVDYVLGSKIVINIQEEETITVIEETKIYNEHNKDNKYINYNINAAQQNIVNEENYFLKYAMDDEELKKAPADRQNNCTNYSETEFTVNVHKKYTSHSYVFEITEADTWIARYKKTYANQPVITQPDNITTAEINGQYKQINTVSVSPIIDNNVTTFINQTKGNYEPKIIVPQHIIISDVLTDVSGKNYKLLSVKYKDGSTKEYTKVYEVVDASGNGTGVYILPPTITITTSEVGATNKTKEIPALNYLFRLQTEVYGSFYYLQTNVDPLVDCIVSKLNIEKFQKIDLNNTIKTTITEYPADTNPITENHIYAVDDEGNFEKFLIAYDNSSGAQNQLNSIDSWLFEMMQGRQTTLDFVDIIKYLLYTYDGVDRGVTELTDFQQMFVPSQMNKSNRVDSFNQFVKYLHTFEAGGDELQIYTDSNGQECYKIENRIGQNGLVVGYSIDIETHKDKFTTLGYDVVEGTLIPVDVVDTIEKEEIKNWFEYIKSEVAELELTEYQVYALTSRAYDYGYNSLSADNSTESLNFVDTFKKYWNEETDNKYKEEAYNTNFNHKLYTTFMTRPATTSQEEKRRKSEWCLFQTGYYGYDLLYGSGNGLNEYCSLFTTEFTNNINLYNEDGSVDADSIQQLEDWLTNDLLNTKIHKKDYAIQNGPFAKWWNNDNNVFTRSGLEFQCTWYVYGRTNHFLELHGTTYTMWPGCRSDAGKWYYSSNNGGQKYFECGDEPRENSIAVWAKENEAGHVAYVEAVDTVNNMVYISHTGSGKSWFGITEHTVEGMKTLWGYQLLGYVYLDSPK